MLGSFILKNSSKVLKKSPINDSSIIANLPASEEVKSQVNFKIFKPTKTCFTLDTLDIKGEFRKFSLKKTKNPSATLNLKKKTKLDPHMEKNKKIKKA